jgi:hypothetical protein
MQFLVMHRTSAHWENGGTPTPELIERVGKIIGEIVASGKLVAGDGLRASSLGVRLQFAGGTRTVQKGPLTESKDLIGGFVIVKVTTLDEAIEWATKFASAFGDVEIDLRPVTEAWDIGLGDKPPGLTTTRYMATYKRRGTDSGAPLNTARAAKMEAQLSEMERAGVLVSSVHLEPAAKGACLVMSNGKPLVTDGPFVESKELLGGFVIVREDSLKDAVSLAERYTTGVGAQQVEVRQLIERS